MGVFEVTFFDLKALKAKKGQKTVKIVQKPIKEADFDAGQ